MPTPAAESPRRRLGLRDLHREPFRVFFPSAVALGLLGVAQWPLHFGGYVEFYPGAAHARIMTYGFFGGFIAGFLGTAGPRMLSAPPLRAAELVALLAAYWTTSICHLTGRAQAGEAALIVWMLAAATMAGVRFLNREDMPPPGFAMLPMAALSAIGGAVISLVESRQGEVDLFWVQLRPLIAYQGFLLFTLLGVGGWLLPRFLKLPCQENFPDSRTPPPGWTRKALISLAVSIALVATFFAEAAGWHRSAYAFRFLIVGLWLAARVKGLWKRPHRDAIVIAIWMGLWSVALGYLTLALFPAHRVAWLHLVLVGGLGLVTVGVATRVIYGHSGRRPALQQKKGWFVIATVMMLLGASSRMIGDFIPKILITHYNYGALCWGIGLLVWAWRALPGALIPDPDA